MASFNNDKQYDDCIIDADTIVRRTAHALADDSSWSDAKQCVTDVLSDVYNSITADKYSFILTPRGKQEYRYKIAKTPGPAGLGYKAARKKHELPNYFFEIRQYLIEYEGAQIAEGMEADDLVMIQATKGNNNILCGDDKDYWTYLGDIYNLRTKSLEENKKGSGYLELTEKRKLVGRGFPWFYAQMIIGDTADNIPGIKGLGPVKAFDIFRDCEDEEDYFTEIYLEYISYFEQVAIERLKEIGTLLWIQQHDRRDIVKYWEAQKWI